MRSLAAVILRRGGHSIAYISRVIEERSRLEEGIFS
jgi:hypothetical protein